MEQKQKMMLIAYIGMLNACCFYLMGYTYNLEYDQNRCVQEKNQNTHPYPLNLTHLSAGNHTILQDPYNLMVKNLSARDRQLIKDHG